MEYITCNKPHQKQLVECFNKKFDRKWDKLYVLIVHSIYAKQSYRIFVMICLHSSLICVDTTVHGIESHSELSEHCKHILNEPPMC